MIYFFDPPNDIKINYGLESLNAVGIIYIIGENNTTPTLFTATVPSTS